MLNTLVALSLRFGNLAELVDNTERGEQGYGLGELVINGVPFHVEVIEVEPCMKCGDFGPQRETIPAQHWCEDTKAVSPEREKQMHEIYMAWGGDGPWSTIEDLTGRQFIVVILPYCT